MKSKARSLITVLLIAGVSTGAFLVARREAQKRAYIKIGKYDIRSEGILRVGDLAPDLELERLDGEGLVRFSQLHSSRPLVLLFGSYT
jgi:hypothetical protein